MQNDRRTAAFSGGRNGTQKAFIRSTERQAGESRMGFKPRDEAKIALHDFKRWQRKQLNPTLCYKTPRPIPVTRPIPAGDVMKIYFALNGGRSFSDIERNALKAHTQRPGYFIVDALKWEGLRKCR
jgi:hypothetical protein